MELNPPGLADQALLDKMDQLRELNVQSIELPQLVVLGDYLTGFAFLQAPDAATEDRLRGFKQIISKFTNDALVQIIQEANEVMGIRMTTGDTNPGLCTFSNDTLKIEICGPDEEHFTIIDVPGIFRVSSPPFTTDNDVDLVHNMVQSYMENSRTIILAVLPSNMAEKADPGGVRTMGVLTKPDLVTEVASQKAIKDLVLGKGKQLRLGYCVKAFFDKPVWREIAGSGRCGIGSLKIRLRDLHMSITKKEFPYLKADFAKKLEQRRRELESMGLSRTDQSAQRMYLRRLGSKFQAVTQCALNGYYDSEVLFTETPSLKLITAVTKMNEQFANTFWKSGHRRHTSPHWDDEGEAAHALAGYEVPTQDILLRYPELYNIIETDSYECPKPTAFNNDSIMDHIEKVYQLNRGLELGTFSGSILSATFKEQSEKWEQLVLMHVSRSIGLVHDYVSNLLTCICPDKQVRAQLWETVLVEELRKAYIRAMEQARFLLHIERQGRPSTYNHYFNSEVQKKRRKRIEEITESESFFSKGAEVVPVTSFHNVVNKENTQQVREDILDVLTSYYKVSRKRFVDNVCTQVIGHFLLEGDESPLKIFSSELVMGLKDDELDLIAGEDMETRNQRSTLESDIRDLEAAMKVLRI
ncbi:P-loop containing nucleoside triphosphate hydrolase protein [Lophiotrema nucula]|uniref:P-loop containing nucleoside triphosphate hydrolase protein n=1 Tax=Lophiotrema nucula TaxID=690887 RepID=A0A6A5YE37_9PLEO|nr:P-loop containing nucleoside triphosphate hydrolase protein [Lophiotrema nucula]